MGLIAALTRAGFSITVAEVETNLREETRLTDEAIHRRVGDVARVSIPALPVLGRITSIPSVRGLARIRGLARSADLVLVFPYYVGDAMITLLLRLISRPMVISQNNAFLHLVDDQPREVIQDLWNRSLGLRVLRAASGVRAIGTADQKTFARLGVRNAALLYPLPPPFMDASPATTDGSAPSVSSPDPLPARALRVLVAGRMTFQKGVTTVEEILQTLERDSPRFSRFRFTLVGSARLPKELQALAGRNPERVRNLGFVPAGLASVLQESDVLLMPTLYEGFSRLAIETMYQGVPVIASDIPSLQDTVEPGRTGWLVPRRRTQGFLDALEACYRLRFDDPAGWQAMKARCRSDSADRFGPEVYHAQLDQFVSWLEGQARGRSDGVPPPLGQWPSPGREGGP